jgi:glycosyltransferase involved in cell wall biosynthesis
VSAPLKIAFIVGGLPFGGVENWLLDLAGALLEGNVAVPCVINLSGTGELMPEYERRGIEVVSIGNGNKAINTHRADTLLALRAYLRELDPDIVHTLHFSGDYFGRLAAVGLGKPVFTHLRNIKTERRKYRRVANRLLSYLTTCYLSVSRKVEEMVQEQHNLAGRPSRVLYNAVDPRKLDVEPLDVTAAHGLTGRVVLGVGRLVEQKNFDVLIKAFSLLHKEVPDTSLLILGDGGQMEPLQRLVRDMGLEDCARLPGFIDNADIPGYLRAAYALAMPSDYEGLPVTHVEGLFCGLPAVVSEHVPSIEIAARASLVCTTQVEDVAAKLLRLFSDPALHDDLSRAALAIAPEYSMERYVEKLLAIYAEFIV